MIRLYWLNLIADSSLNFIMMSYSSTQFTLQFNSRIFSHFFFEHDSQSRSHIIRTYSIIRPFSFKFLTTYDFTFAAVRSVLINSFLFSSFSIIVRNISDIENHCVLAKIHNFNTKDSSFSKSKAKKNSNKNDSNWFSSQNEVEFSLSESNSKINFNVVDSTFDDAQFIEFQFHTTEKHFQIALNYMKRSIDNNCFYCSFLQFVDSWSYWLIV